MKELIPCPFCGGKVKKKEGITGITIFVCYECGADVCFYSAERDPEATEAWNRRAENEKNDETRVD